MYRKRPQKGLTDELVRAVHERVERARGVKEEYIIESAGSGTYFVEHPSEPERTYIVQLGKGTCDCPDFSCNTDLPVCKHLAAVRMMLGMPDALPEPMPRLILVPDPDDPFRD